MQQAHRSETGYVVTADQERELGNLRRLSNLLDQAIPLPGGFRIGLDGIIGLIPGAGDTIGAVLSSYIIVQAARLGVPTGVLLKMIGNVALDTVVGVIPVAGDLFDFAWKANTRNIGLLERHFGRSRGGERGDRRLWWVIAALVVLFLVALGLVVWGIIELLFALAAA